MDSRSRKRLIQFMAAAVLLAVIFFGLQFRARNVALSDSKKQVAAGTAAFKQGKFKEAASGFKEAVRLDPKNPEAQSGLGRSLEATGKLDGAAAAYQASLVLKPDQPEILYNLALIYKSQGQDQKAVAELEKAIKLNDRFVGARLTLGDLYAQLGENDKARQQYQAVLDMKPFGVDLSRIQAKLETLK